MLELEYFLAQLQKNFVSPEHGQIEFITKKDENTFFVVWKESDKVQKRVYVQEDLHLGDGYNTKVGNN